MRITKDTGYGKRIVLLALTAGALAVHGQDREKFDSLAAKYKGQHAVYSHIGERLEITVEDGVPVANSYTTLEKLLISEGSLSNCNMDYFYYSDFNDLTSLSGNAYLPEKGNRYKKVACTGFGSGSPRSFVFYDDLRYVVAYYSGLKKNTVTETKYSRSYPDLHMLPEFDFEDAYLGLPVANATYEVVAPYYVKMNFVIKGDNGSKVKQSKEEKNGMVYYRFTATDMPAFKTFDNVPSSDYYLPHVIPYIVSYRLPGAAKDSVIANSADDLYKYIYNYVRHRDMKLDTFLTRTTDKLVENDATPEEKAAHIYKWVQNNIHYIAFENGLEGFRPRPADTVFKRKYGDCKDMTAITVAMCRRAGLDAHFTWVGTNALPYEHTDVPLYLLFNHMICAVKINGQWVFMDGTHKTLPFGHNREDIQGKEAMIAIDENNYEIVRIPVENADENVSTDSTHISIDGPKITGNVKQWYKGYGAWNLGYLLLYNRKEDDRQKAVKALTQRGSDKYVQQKYTMQASKKGNRDVEVNAAFTVDDYVHEVGRQCIVNMNLLRYFEDNDIDTKDRTAASYFDYKKKHREVVVLDIPKGYRVTYLPHGEKKSLDGIMSYSISYKADKHTITLVKEYELSTLSVSPGRFDEYNNMIESLKRAYRESVVLTTNSNKKALAGTGERDKIAMSNSNN